MSIIFFQFFLCQFCVYIFCFGRDVDCFLRLFFVFLRQFRIGNFYILGIVVINFFVVEFKLVYFYLSQIIGKFGVGDLYDVVLQLGMVDQIGLGGIFIEIVGVMICDLCYCFVI